MLRRLILATLITTLALSGAAAASDGRWIHVRVLEDGGEESVRVNLPLSMVANLLPLIDADEFHRGIVHINDPDFRRLDLRGMVEELKNAPDAEFVTVKDRGDSVRVSKAGGFLLVQVDEDDGQRVRVRVPMQVADALLSGPSDQLDLVAAVRALGEHGMDGDLVTVEDGDTSVRVWIDYDEQGP